MNKVLVLILDELLPKGFLGVSSSISGIPRESGKQQKLRTGRPKTQNKGVSLSRKKGGKDVKEKEAPRMIRKALVSDLPLWGNFKVRDLLDRFYPKGSDAVIFPVRERGAFKRLVKFLEKGEGKQLLIVGRTANITLVDWRKLISSVRGTRTLAKLQVGKVPSDLYVIKKGELLDVVSRWDGEEELDCRDFMSWFFDGFLFHSFEKILDLRGFSILLRNSYEYYRENILIADSLGVKQYDDLYRRINPGTLANTIVTESGEVVSSVLGGGVKVEGVVKNSVIFGSVTVKRSAVVQSSVILPSNEIEEGVTLRNALVLEGNRRVIGSGSEIGGGQEVENRLYPDILKHGLTVIGERIQIPADSSIGSGCLVTGSGVEPSGPIDLYDGEVFDTERRPAQ
jgi:hypothetical protein